MNKQIYERIMTSFLSYLTETDIFFLNFVREQRNWALSTEFIQFDYRDEYCYHFGWLKDVHYE